MTCANCKQEVIGEMHHREGQFEDGTMFILILRPRDCDWLGCDSCNAPVHMRCYPDKKSGYCDQCTEKFKFFDIDIQEVTET